MPELPEVESARSTIEAAALGRRIADVDDSDTYECRPHAPGEIRDALVGRRLTAAHRQGKTMWCDTSGVGRSRTPGPVLGLHLGMSGRILVSGPDGEVTEGGDWQGGRYGRGGEEAGRNPVWDRFTLVFSDGGRLRLFDKRRSAGSGSTPTSRARPRRRAGRAAGVPRPGGPRHARRSRPACSTSR